MKAFFAALTVFITTFLMASIAIAVEAPFKNLDQIAQTLSLSSYADVQSKRTIKIAILDNGFAGRDDAGLPAGTMYHAGPIAVDPKTEETHGTYMAQLVAGLLAKTPDVACEMHLYSAYGYTNLKTAIADVVANKFDVVLYAQVWEYGGNGDGRGFINTLVNQATDAGLIWINAAGNFGNATYTAPVEVLKDDWAFLPSVNGGVRVRCIENKTKKCTLRAVLSWNDFKDNADIGTDKDLDLVLTDDTLKVIHTGGLQQVITIPAGAAPGQSLYPREIVEAELTPGLYELRAKARSKNFTKAVDSLKIVTSGDYIEQLDTTSRFETLLAPADNAGVITVGASDSEKSSASKSMGKPEFKTPSDVQLKNGDSFKGSSNSAAMAAVLAVIARAQTPTADRNSVLEFLRANKTGGVSQPTTPPNQTAPSTGALTAVRSSQLGFGPTGPGCFIAVQMPALSDAVKPLLQKGAAAVQTTVGVKIFTTQDPWSIDLGVDRVNDDDMLVIGAQVVRVLPRSVQAMLSTGLYEVVEAPLDARLCR